jgi:hypothetical protein
MVKFDTLYVSRRVSECRFYLVFCNLCLSYGPMLTQVKSLGILLEIELDTFIIVILATFKE